MYLNMIHGFSFDCFMFMYRSHRGNVNILDTSHYRHLVKYSGPYELEYL